MEKKFLTFVAAGAVLAGSIFAQVANAKSADRRANAESTKNFSGSQTGLASVYGNESGSRTASGRRLQLSALTAAHRSLPFGTKVLVTNKRNGRTVTVEINDRGPFVRGRIIDLTPAGARALGFSGLTSVSLTVVRPNADLKTREARS